MNARCTKKKPVSVPPEAFTEKSPTSLSFSTPIEAFRDAFGASVKLVVPSVALPLICPSVVFVKARLPDLNITKLKLHGGNSGKDVITPPTTLPSGFVQRLT